MRDMSHENSMWVFYFAFVKLIKISLYYWGKTLSHYLRLLIVMESNCLWCRASDFDFACHGPQFESCPSQCAHLHPCSFLPLAHPTHPRTHSLSITEEVWVRLLNLQRVDKLLSENPQNGHFSEIVFKLKKKKSFQVVWIADVAVTERHQWLDEIFIYFFLHFIKKLSKIVFKETLSCNTPAKLDAIMFASCVVLWEVPFLHRLVFLCTVYFPGRVLSQNSLRLRLVFVETDRVCHVYCNF